MTPPWPASSTPAPRWSTGVSIVDRVIDHGRTREAYYDIVASWGPAQYDIIRWSEAVTIAEAMLASRAPFVE